MKKSAGLVSIIIGIVTGIQIIGQIIIARIFGARIELDAFVSAVTIPTILTTVITGTLNDAFLPLLKKKQLASEEHGNVYFIKLTLLLSIFALLVSVALDIFSTPILYLIFGSRGNEFIALTDSLMQMMVYTIPFTLVGAFSTSYLYSKNKFIINSLAYLIGSSLNLLIIVVSSQSYGIWSMVIAFISAIIIQLFIVFPFKLTSYIGSALPLLLKASTLTELTIFLRAWIPLIISTLAVRFDSVIIRSFASRLPEGYIVYTNLASKLFSGLVGVMTIGLQIVFFPHLIDLVHGKNFRMAKEKVQKAKLYGTILTVAIILVIVYISPYFMRIFLTGGKFSGNNVEVLISLFPYFIAPAIGWGISQLFFQPIIAIGKQYLLTLLNVTAVCLSWIVASIIFPYWGGLVAISVGLIILTFTGIIGAEIIWNIHLKKHLA